MSVCACVKITMGRSGQSADGSAVSAGAWAVSAAEQGASGLGEHSPCVSLVSKGRKREQPEWPAGSSPVSAACPQWLCSTFGGGRAPTRAKHPLPASLGLLAG